MSEAQDRQTQPLADMVAPESVAAMEDLRTWQERLIQGILTAVGIVGILVAAVATYDSYINQEYWTIPLYWGSYAIIVLFLFWRRAPHALRVWGIVGLVYVLGATDFLQDGRSGSALLFMLIMPFLAGLLLGRRASIVTLILGTLTMVSFGVAFSIGLLATPGDPSSADLAGWSASALTLFMLGLLIVVSLNYLVPRLAATLEQSRKLALELAQQRDRLEEEVMERTVALTKRSTQLETAAKVARDAAAIQDVEQLLQETVHLISERFGFYHTGIFLLDQASDEGGAAYAVLRAASSEGGQSMLARGHRLKVGEVGIVGYVTEHGVPRIALDVGEDAVYFDNPDLPETRSEVALPLRARGQVIGALDVQSRKPDAFGEEDVAVLQTLADQIATAISNARLFRQAQESLEAERRAYGELSRQAWQDLFRAQPDLEQRYDPQGILPDGGNWREEMVQALQLGQPVQSDDRTAPTVAIPLTVRDQVIGVLDAHKPEGAGAWTSAEMELLQSLIDQLGVALDSARLYEDTQRRAARDRMLSEVTARMRESLDVETVIRTAAHEMQQALGLSSMTIQLAAQQDVLTAEEEAAP